MSNTIKKQSVLVKALDLSSVLSTLADNIEEETDCISLIGTKENLTNIEKENKFANTDTVVALGEGEFKERVSNIAENTCLSSGEAIYYAEKLNCLTNEEATEMYRDIQCENPDLPQTYQDFKGEMRPMRARAKLAKIRYLLCLSSEKIKNVFQLKRQN